MTKSFLEPLPYIDQIII